MCGWGMDRRGSLAKSVTAAQTMGMSSHVALFPRGARALLTSLTLALAVAAPLASSPALAADPSAEPMAAVSPAPSAAAGETLCASAADLRLIVGFLRETSISEDGVVPLVVGGLAGIAEARTLAGLAGETYRPLVDDLVASLQGLRTTVDELGDQATAGAGVASIGEALTDVGNAMDALSVQLGSCAAASPVPVEPVPVASPAAAASPAAEG